MIANLRQLHDARRALQRVRKSQHAAHAITRITASFQLERTLRQAADELFGFDAKIAVRIFSH
jgi:hypothetical protein